MAIELTPRSKVAKMLADIDNAPTPSPPLLAPSPSPPLLSAPQIALNTQDDSPAQGPTKREVPTAFLDEIGSDADDDPDDLRRPKGRAAGRMHRAFGSSPPRPPAQTGSQESDDELYSATPLRPSKRAAPTSESPTSTIASNGLFVSPAKSISQASNDDLPTRPWRSSLKRLKNGKGRKHAESQADRSEDKQGSVTNSSDLPEEAFENSQDPPVDPAIEKIMSDASRPARKASKKALLEMERETQRLSRQQALAHQMRVKKKFTTEDLFAKFNFRRPAAIFPAAPERQTEGDTTASSAPNSDGPEERNKEPLSTPPSSPPTPLDRQKALVEQGALSKLVPVRQDSIASLASTGEDEDLPDLADLLTSSQRQAAVIRPAEQEKKGLKLARLGKGRALSRNTDSDDELDIVETLPRQAQMFEKALGMAKKGRPVDSKAIHALKHLSHIVSRELQPAKKGSRPSIAPDVLEAQLRRRAREQARQQQLERIEELKAKGIDVQTTEEREKEAEAFEDLLEKARQDAVDLRKAEKAARRQAGGDATVEISDDEDEDEDEEYVGSGSEDEDIEEAHDDDEADGNNLVDEAAEETDERGEESADADDDEPEDESEQLDPEQPHEVNDSHATDRTPAMSRVRKTRVILDDEDEDEDDLAIQPPATVKDSTANNDPFAAFNFGGAHQMSTLMSPTQAFNATMQTPSQAAHEDSFDILRHLAPPSSSSLRPSLPDLETQLGDDLQEDIVGSQVPESQRITLDWETQMPETPVPAGVSRGPSGLSETPGWEPTQDGGLESPWSVRRKAPNEDGIVESPTDYETQSTVNLRVSESPAPSQTIERRGRLGRRRLPVEDDSDDESNDAFVGVEKRDAFREMARRRKEALTAAEKADVDKEMRGMMDEQAEESEDEYAGLGGDDFVAPETEQDREMIDSSNIEVDERAIAAHFAERERVRMEEETSKLYKDLTTGMLRRKMASNAFDLEEDEDEIEARRRQMRQLEETKKRKALLRDENIAHLADGKPSKGREAFLRAIADDDGDDDGLELAATQDDSTAASQDDSTQSQDATAGPLREIAGNKRKDISGDRSDEERPAAKLRRIEAATFKRPTSLLEVKESVSFLLEDSNPAEVFGPSVLEPNSDPENEDVEEQQIEEFDDDDDEVEAEIARQNDGGYAPNPASFDAKAMPPPRLPASQRRTAPKPAVVDRLSLKRASSSGSESAHGRTAWSAGPTTGGFKVPSLLRRATTNTTSFVNDRGVTTPNLSRENSGGVKMGGSKKSSLAYQARAEERKAIVEASAKRREENTARIAQMRRNSSALSKGLTGRFE